MPNRFFAPDTQRAERVNELFTRIARRYDLINDLQSFGLHRIWKRRVALLARAKRGDSALDICCGTGDLAHALAATGARVTGLDFNPQMLAIARKKIRTDTKIEFVQGDALNLPFPENSFDIVTVGYGLRNLADWERGLAEMARIARPAARLINLDFGKPDNPLWRAVYFTYLRVIVPGFGLAFSANPAAYAYIIESLRHYPAQHGVAARMRELGLVNTLTIQFLGGAMAINYAEVAAKA